MVGMRSRIAGGFTLIEVLIALLVLAVGIIGAGGAQLTALRTRHDTARMSDAVQLVAGLADRMRANPQQMRLDDARNPYAGLDYDAASGAPAASTVACFTGTNCNSAELAAFDLSEVQTALASGFPDGRILVCRDRAGVDEGAGAGADAAGGSGAALSWRCVGGPGAPLVIKLGWRGRAIAGTRGDGAAGSAGASEASAAQQFEPVLAVVVAGAST
jgi:type IV pilus assembly protein PilV